MVDRWQGKGTEEAKGYAEKIDTAWDDIYMGKKGGSSSRKELRKLLKIGAGLLPLKLYGDRQVEKYGNDALSRADAYLDAGAGGILIHSKSESEEEILYNNDTYNLFTKFSIVLF